MSQIPKECEWMIGQMEKYFAKIEKLEAQIEELQRENRHLNRIKCDVEVALASIHEEDEHGNVRAYRFDDAISKIRQAVYGNEEKGFVYNFPWGPDTIKNLDRLAIR
jgi:predicted RNase H-like nuclease (RuvC/YqgF family)